MAIWTVYVNGLGGPRAEFLTRTYQTTAETAGDAVNQAIEEFNKDMDNLKVKMNYEDRYNFYSAKVTEEMFGIKRID